MKYNAWAPLESYEKYLRFYEDLLAIQVKNMQHLIAVISFKKLNKIDIDSRLENGEQLITADEVLLDEKELEHIFESIVPLLRKTLNNQKELKIFEELNDKRKIQLIDLVKNVLLRDVTVWDDMAHNYLLTKEFLVDIGEWISMPYLELCSEYFNKKLKSRNWESPGCPICGNRPSIAMVDEETGVRTLWCHLCDTEWNYPDQICPFCENKDLKKIRHIFPMDSSPYRVDGCDKCGQFLKVIDKNMITENPKFAIEYLKTYELDRLALQKGYKKFNFLLQDE